MDAPPSSREIDPGALGFPDGYRIEAAVASDQTFDKRNERIVISEQALLHELEVERARANTAERRSAFLAELGGVLASSLDYDTTLTNVARLAVPTVADLALLDILDDDGALRRRATAHRDAECEALLAATLAYPPDPARSPLARPLFTGEPVLLPNVSEMDLEEIAPTPTYRELLRQLSLRAVLSLPLVAHGQRRGILTLAMAGSGRAFDPAERPAAVELARSAALAVENAAHYRASQQALRARERVLSIVSHELRNPLSTIRMSTHLLLDVAGVPEPRRVHHLGLIHRATEQMEHLIEDLLDFARLDAGQGLVVDRKLQPVGPLLAEVAETFASRAAAKLVSLRCEPGNELGSLAFDRYRLFRALANLVSNAVKFTLEGGEVDLRAEVVPGGVRFVVADTGTGIDEKDVERVFDPYWQARGTASLGTGLGLPIVRSIVEAHGGRIDVASRPGSGTTFSFTLPAAPEA